MEKVISLTTNTIHCVDFIWEDSNGIHRDTLCGKSARTKNPNELNWLDWQITNKTTTCGTCIRKMERLVERN